MPEDTNNFFALLKDDTVKRISLSDEVSSQVQELFDQAQQNLITSDTREIRFDGNYRVQEEEILFVPFAIPGFLADAILNPLSCDLLNLKKDKIKGLFWGVKDQDEVKELYLQNFDSRGLLTNKSVLIYSSNTYSKMEQDAFILDDKLAAILRNEKLYFASYQNAKKLFDLSEFYREATNEDIDAFTASETLEIDNAWLKDIANTNIRKQITLALKSDVLKEVKPFIIQKQGKEFNLTFEVENDKLKIPNDKKRCYEFLEFLNEKYYKGILTGNKFRTNSNVRIGS